MITPRRLSKLFNMADRYITGHRRVRTNAEGVHPLFISILKIVLRDVIEGVDTYKCPYCGAAAKAKGGLIRHMKCAHYYEYHSDIMRAIDVYTKFMDMAVHSVGGLTVRGNGISITGNKTRIAWMLERDPAILEKLGIRY
jgi:uncharacterized C2H2 Zn-finger protein